jgi:hypothetical protein
VDDPAYCRAQTANLWWIVDKIPRTYGIDFMAHGFEPERLASMTSILDFVDEAGA